MFKRIKKFMMKSAETGFTLIELLVVIAIISMLAGQLLPALSTAREKGRQANCINNLHQMGLAIEIYYQDFNDYPTWLSILYKNYLATPKIFICLTDLYKGTRGHGCRDKETGNPKFFEANDIPPEQIPGYSSPYDAGFNYRNPTITACSYIYEFNPCKCSWFDEKYNPDDEEWKEADTNGDKIVTWKEAKIWQSLHGYGGQVPIVRCFWHYYNHNQKVLNLAFRDYNVYTSGPEWETSSY
ncbi:type II secretion system protein [bacterium]|nr:type II secretion system protein [bacterium]